MAQPANISAAEQFISFVSTVKSMTRKENVGKEDEKRIFYGNNNINTDLKKRVIGVIGQDVKLFNDETEYYFLMQKDVFAMVPIANIIKFLNESKHVVTLPPHILKLYEKKDSVPYFAVALDIQQQYKLYATEKKSDTKIKYMIFIKELIVENSFDHHLTIFATCGRYNIDDNELSSSCDLLKSVLKRKNDEIAEEYKLHQHFDEKQNEEQNAYHELNSQFNDINLRFLSHIEMLDEAQGFKPGQIYKYEFETETGPDATSIFYISLLQEDPSNEMAKKWLMERGYFGVEQQQILLNQFGAQQPTNIEQGHGNFLDNDDQERTTSILQMYGVDCNTI